MSGTHEVLPSSPGFSLHGSACRAALNEVNPLAENTTERRFFTCSGNKISAVAPDARGK